MKDAKNYIIAALLLITVGLILFQPSQPQDQTEGKAFKDAIDKLTFDKAKKDAQINFIFQQSEHKDSITKVQLKAKDKEISHWKAKAGRHEANIPADVRAQNPSIDSALNANKEVIRSLEAKNDTLRRAHDFQVAKVKNLQTLVIDKDRIANEMFTTCSERVDKLQRNYEKEHKKKIGWRKVAAAALIVAVVEGVILSLH